ncbi:hypothetical protein THAOC_22812, partial [Thalassiosira oceanica]
AHAKKSSPAGGSGGRRGESPGRSACNPPKPAHDSLSKQPILNGEAEVDRRISSLKRSEFHFDFDGDVTTLASSDGPGGGRPGIDRSRSFVGFKQGEKETIRKGASIFPPKKINPNPDLPLLVIAYQCSRRSTP